MKNLNSKPYTCLKGRNVRQTLKIMIEDHSTVQSTIYEELLTAVIIVGYKYSIIKKIGLIQLAGYHSFGKHAFITEDCYQLTEFVSLEHIDLSLDSSGIHMLW